MKYAAAYCMAVVAGKDSPTAKDVKKILDSIEAEVDDAVLEKLVSELDGKSIHEVIAAGRETLQNVPMGGGGGGGGAAAAAAGCAAPAEAKKEEVVEEEEEEMDFDLLGGAAPAEAKKEEVVEEEEEEMDF